MTPERWRSIEELYHAAQERDARGRGAFLAEACAGDEELKVEVQKKLLAMVERFSAAEARMRAPPPPSQEP
jgi:hypothetical protein